MTTPDLTCRDCNGDGTVRGYGCPGLIPVSITCDRCEGSGQMPVGMPEWIKTGKARRDERVARGVSMQDEAATLSIEPADLSDLERGMVDPWEVR